MLCPQPLRLRASHTESDQIAREASVSQLERRPMAAGRPKRAPRMDTVQVQRPASPQGSNQPALDLSHHPQDRRFKSLRHDGQRAASRVGAWARGQSVPGAPERGIRPPTLSSRGRQNRCRTPSHTMVACARAAAEPTRRLRCRLWRRGASRSLLTSVGSIGIPALGCCAHLGRRGSAGRLVAEARPVRRAGVLPGRGAGGDGFSGWCQAGCRARRYPAGRVVIRGVLPAL